MQERKDVRSGLKSGSYIGNLYILVVEVPSQRSGKVDSAFIENGI